MVIISIKYFYNPTLKKAKYWVRRDLALRSCCDLDLQGSDPIFFLRDTSSQYGDNLCEIVLKSKFMGRKRILDVRTDGPDGEPCRLFAPPFFGEYNKLATSFT